MRFDSILKSNHDLKKNGYKMIKKLHSLELRKGANKAYYAQIGNTYMFVQMCVYLVEIINYEYPQSDPVVSSFSGKCNAFLKYLDEVALRKGKINKTILGGFLRSYTRFFNYICDSKFKFSFDQTVIDTWNQKCIMSYISTWPQS